jgi:hypothetical protein
MLRQSEVGRVAELGKIWTDLTFWHKSGFSLNFAMISPETLYTKNAVNELNFPLVTHTANFDTWFGRYRFLNSGCGAELILDRLL